MTEFVFATGSSSVTFPNNTVVKVPIAPRYGDASMISNGHFVATKRGYWKFNASTITGGVTMRVLLLDDTGAILADLGRNIDGSVESGFTVLPLDVGDIVWLGASQFDPASKTITANASALHSKLLATFLGAADEPPAFNVF